MKKIYKEPAFELIQLETQQMLALSTSGTYKPGDPVHAPRHRYDKHNIDDEEDEEEDW